MEKPFISLLGHTEKYPSTELGIRANIYWLNFLAYDFHMSGKDPNKVILHYNGMKLASLGFVKLPSVN